MDRERKKNIEGKRDGVEGVRGGENTVVVGGTGGKCLFKHKLPSSSQGATT